MSTSTSRDPLEPFPYHREAVECLRAGEPGLWAWFASDRRRADAAEAVRLELLKSTYRLDPAAHADLYALAEGVRGSLGIAAPLTLYQSQNDAGLNAALAYVPGEAHLVLRGPIADALAPAELATVLAHELGHFLLWEGWEGAYFTADRLLDAMAADPAAAPSHVRTARLYALYTELFADRAALAVSGDPLPAITALLKTATGLREVSAESYLRQAEEIFRKDAAVSQQDGHPEPFIRARAAKLRADGGAAALPAIAAMIEGPPALDALDLPGQRRLTALTRRLLERLLAPAWLRSDALLAHARLFFPDLAPADRPADDAALAADLRFDDAGLRDYLCYVLLDFAAADRALEDAPLAASFVLAERLGLGDRLFEVADEELKIRKRRLERIRKDAEAIAAAAGGQTSA